MRNLLSVLILLIAVNGCRDYLSNTDSNLLPALFTDAVSYSPDDTITITISNKSDKVIYTKEVFNFAEVKINGNWLFYSSYSCNNCSELSIVKDQTYSVKRKLFTDAGVYRFVCLYSNEVGTPEENKLKLFSNEFKIN